MKLVLFLSFVATIVHAREGFGPSEQEWGYATVRKNAHMFWWLHKTLNADVTNYTERPLVIWLQGGPGASSTGFGNFGEIGPWDADKNERKSTWVNNYNVLFVDNPVGTGYSYVDDLGALTTTNSQIAEDFVVLLQSFYETLPELKQTPLYIFCESYGGKMTAEIALKIDQASKAGTLEAKLVGVGLGDSWISPIDSVMTWAPYLLNVGILDQNGYEKIQEVAQATKEALDAGNFDQATNLWGLTEQVVSQWSYDVDFYNILNKIDYSFKEFNKFVMPGLTDEQDDKIEYLMNNDVKKALNVSVTWGRQSGSVFSALSTDFMKPVTSIVEQLLNETDITVAVYSGQLDLIVDTPGTVKWVDALQFKNSDQWKTADRNPIITNSIVEGYYKKLGSLAFYWVNRAGHMVPADNPNGMKFILEDVIKE